MKGLLILRNVRVENANAIAGHTWGFPAVTHFLGYIHALSRLLQQGKGKTLGGCAIVCHQHQVQACQPGGYGDYVFSLTRNPLTKAGNTPAFVEEGRMNLEVSLIIACDFGTYDLNMDGDEARGVSLFCDYVQQLALTRKLAGGSITSIRAVEFEPLSTASQDREKQTRKLLLSLLPGFVLTDRSQLLQEHMDSLKAKGSDVELLDVWLEFFSLRFGAVQTESIEDNEASLADTETLANEVGKSDKAIWRQLPKPGLGWLVPLVVGYKGISPLYENGEVARTRDSETPFRFVELVYGIGQWQSPHRCQSIDQLLWHYHQEDDWYLCQQTQFAPTQSETV